MKVKALKVFSDMENKVIRKPGEIFEVTEERAEQIIAANPELIEHVEAEEGKPEFPKHIAGGMYLLSNGEKVKGKEAAFKAEEALKSKE